MIAPLSLGFYEALGRVLAVKGRAEWVRPGRTSLRRGSHQATLLRFRMPRALDLDRIIRQLERGGVSALERQPFQP